MPDRDYLFVEIQKHNYERALQLYRDFSVKNVSRSVKSVGLLLERINEEIKLLPVSQTYTENFVEEIMNVMMLERILHEK